MEFQTLLKDDDAVSPVIGVILMVAITVILAAVIGTFVLGLGDQVQETAPSAQIQFEGEPAELEVTHEGGDALQQDEISLAGDASASACDSWDGGSGTITAGDTCDLSGESLTSSDSVSVVWQGEGDRSSTLATWEGDDA